MISIRVNETCLFFLHSKHRKNVKCHRKKIAAAVNGHTKKKSNFQSTKVQLKCSMLASIIIDWNQWISSMAAWIFDNFIYWLRAKWRLSNRNVFYCDRLWDIGRCYGRAIISLPDLLVAQPPGCTASWPSWDWACLQRSRAQKTSWDSDIIKTSLCPYRDHMIYSVILKNDCGYSFHFRI